MKISFFFALYDFWIGVFYDRKKRTWYICPLPCCVFKIEPRSFELDSETIRMVQEANFRMALQCAVEGHSYQDVPGLGVVCVTCGKSLEERNK